MILRMGKEKIKVNRSIKFRKEKDKKNSSKETNIRAVIQPYMKRTPQQNQGNFVQNPN